MEATVVSYMLAALAFSALAYASRERNPDSAGLLIPACATALWSALLALESLSGAGRELVAVAELGRDVAWLWYLQGHFQAIHSQPGLRWVSRGLLAVALPLHLSALFTADPQALFWVNVVLPILFSVAVLVFVEQIWRNTAPQQRWSIKFVCLGLGGAFAFDFYLFSEAMLFSRQEPDSWSARGAIHVFLAPLLWVAQRRLVGIDQGWGLSHRMAFHTATLLGSGVYLLLMAVAGYYIRHAGGTWGTLLQAMFLAGAILMLLLVLLSGSARARLKTFLAQHFFRYRYDYREQWLRFTSLLDSGQTVASIQLRVLEAMARLVDSVGAGLWLRHESGSFRPAAEWHLPQPTGEIPQDHPFILRLARQQTPVDLPELREQLKPESPPPDWLMDSPRAWLVIPLIWHDRLIGFVVLAPSLAQVGFDWEINELLRTASRQATAYLVQAEAAEALSIARQFESFSRTTAFVVHDIKNLIAQLSLLLSNAKKHRDNPEFQEDMLSTIESAVTRMNRMLSKLSEPGRRGEPETIDLHALMNDVVREKASSTPRPELVCLGPPLWMKANPERLAGVLGHMIQNAIEATPGEGKVGVTLERIEERAVICVEDNGHGMDGVFVREKLFRPFFSTKGAGMGIGAYECKEYVEELGGFIHVDSQPGKGTKIIISLPIALDNPA